MVGSELVRALQAVWAHEEQGIRGAGECWHICRDRQADPIHGSRDFNDGKLGPRPQQICRVLCWQCIWITLYASILALTWPSLDAVQRSIDVQVSY